MQVGAGLSRTTDAAIAAAEAADQAAVALGAVSCDLAVVVVSGEHVGDLAAVAAAVEMRLEPSSLLGGAAQGVIGPDAELEAGPGVAVWAAHLDAGMAQPFRAWTVRASDGSLAVAGWPDTRPGDVTLVLADPLSFPVGPVLDRLGEQRPGQPVIGGLLTAGDGRSGFVLDDQVHEDGLVGVVLRDVAAHPLVSQGCRPVGDPLTVTRAVGDRLLELGGRSAMARLDELVLAVSDEDRGRLQRGGVHLGVVVDEQRDAYGTGDFLIRGVLGVDEEDGAMTVGDVIAPGRIVQFHVRDSASADADLAVRLDAAPPAAAALLFSCTGRGAGLFGRPDHDLGHVRDHVGSGVVGAFCAGEIGPVGARSYLHAFTASVLLFGDDPDPAP
ncbi:MAG: FIST C-terminal domain-containing protein [Nitriliruptoraceae bacterium]|nr:FIST C-terminal domain-containing protein [Nitriliruptoraceae bacterium]